ncbi:MAG TPA: hypothetical protein ENK18_01565 [Deltaproteobacteria bacterium]|nr:hypothetical protein [Deltaproteobacteria bacterium]
MTWSHTRPHTKDTMAPPAMIQRLHRALWPLLLLLAGCPYRADLVNQLESEVIALKSHTRMLKEELATCGSPKTPGSLYAELTQVFMGSEITVEQRGAATVIRVRASHIYSDAYSLELREEADKNLDLLGLALLLNPDHQVMVLGHTNDRPIPEEWQRRYESLVALSIALSITLTEHLIEHYDLDPRRFTNAGRGPYTPIASNDLESGQDANHRLEILLYPNGALPPAPR